MSESAGSAPTCLDWSHFQVKAGNLRKRVSSSLHVYDLMVLTSLTPSLSAIWAIIEAIQSVSLSENDELTDQMTASA